MQVSKNKLKAQVQKQITEIFCQAIADLRKPEEVKIFVRDFFTKTEQTAIVKRLAIAIYLQKSRSYEQIKQALKVSSATIANVDKMMNKKGEGFAMVLKKIEAEEWALNLAKKLSGVFKKTN